MSKNNPRYTNRQVRVNPFRVFYYRTKVNMSINKLAELSGVSRLVVSSLERGLGKSKTDIPEISDFPTCRADTLSKIEKVLKCRGKLKAGKNDNETLLVSHYLEYKLKLPAEVTSLPSRVRANEPFLHSTRAIVFDFDGTLTSRQGLSLRTTWEKLWEIAGYTVNDCGDLAKLFFNKRITHQEWCDLTLEKFRAGGITRQMVSSVGKQITLINGIKSVLGALKDNGVELFIVSGSIYDIIVIALGELRPFFKNIGANSFSYDIETDLINHIQGTKYDFETKGDFVKEICRMYEYDPLEVLFIGNSINDRHVKRVSGCRTLLINEHLTHAGDNDAWDHYIREVTSLEQILPQVKYPSQNVAEVKSSPRTVDLLAGIHTFDISEMVVVGEYRRFDSEARGQLRNTADQIMAKCTLNTNTRENFLLWGPSGSGKTFLIKQIEKALLATGVKTFMMNLADERKAAVEAKLDEVVAFNGKCLCFIDEVDGIADDDLSYAHIFTKLDVNMNNGRDSLVFVLAGSKPGGIQNMVESIKNFRNGGAKGADLLTRLFINQHKIIPPIGGDGDTLCVFVTNILMFAKSRNITINRIEKKAAFYAITFPGSKTARQLEMLAHKAVTKAKSTLVIHYDDLFEKGEGERDLFRDRHLQDFALLGTQQIDIK